MSSLLLTPLPAPFDWLSLGLLTGPVGLFLIGVGAAGLRVFAGGEPDVER